MTAVARERRHEVAVEELEVGAFTVPTDAPESDGTLAWDSTTIVVVHARAGEACGVGYTYADLSTATLVRSKLAGVVHGMDALAPQSAWEAMVRACRNLGRPGISSMAIAAVDCALWDLKARLLELPLCSLLGTAREARAGVRLGRVHLLLAGPPGRAAVELGAGGDSTSQDEGRLPRPSATPRACGPPATRSGRARSCSSTRTARMTESRRWRSLRASPRIRTSAGSRSRSPPTTSTGSRCCATACPPRCGSPQANTATTCRTSAAWRRASTCSRRMSRAARGSPSCCGSTGCARAQGLGLSLHCGPSIHLHPALALDRLVHLEYFHDHTRIERMLFEVSSHRSTARCTRRSIVRETGSSSSDLTQRDMRLDRWWGNVRAGRMQRTLAAATAFSALPLGVEIYFEHFRGSFGDKWMWTPVALSPALTVAGIAGVRSERAARTWLPALSALYCLDGAVGVVTHVRGVARKPGGFHEPLFNIVMGPPLLAPGIARARRRPGSGGGVLRARAVSGRDFSLPDHLPNRRSDGQPASPEELPRQRSGITPQMHGRYPDYNVLDEQATTGTKSRAGSSSSASTPCPPIRFFTAPEAATLGAFCDLLMAQDREPRVPVLAMVDQKLFDGRLDGYRYADMPDDRETWRRVAEGLDSSARPARRVRRLRGRTGGTSSISSSTRSLAASCAAWCGIRCHVRTHGRSSRARC